jgi:hypothetical protein
MRIFSLSLAVLLMLSTLPGCSYSEWKASQYKSDVEVTSTLDLPGDEILEAQEELAAERELESASQEEESADFEENVDFEQSDVETTSTLEIEAEIKPPTDNLPAQINLDVTFYSQAPFGDWGMPYQEACEEASLLLAYNYVMERSVTAEEFEQELLDMVAWEVTMFGQYEHTTIEQTARILNEYLEYGEWEILTNPSEEELKSHLAAGNPIVAPFAGRYLGNPYFTGLGPVYHMLVIRGYDDTHFITNDVGTRHGENFIYEYNILMNALHDWHDDAKTDDEGILMGSKQVLILRKL